MSFELRGKTVHIKSATVYESSHYDAKPIDVIADKSLIIHGVIIASRSRNSNIQQPYLYIEKSPVSAHGIWQHEADLEPAD